MKQEIRCAAQFLTGIVRRGTEDKIADLFYDKLCKVLAQRYAQHWHPRTPSRGTAYRCLRNNHQLDPLIVEAAQAARVPDIHLLLPKELTLWVDPCEVSYRIGEDGSICTLPVPPEKDASPEKPRPASPPVSISRAVVQPMPARSVSPAVLQPMPARTVSQAVLQPMPSVTHVATHSPYTTLSGSPVPVPFPAYWERRQSPPTTMRKRPPTSPETSRRVRKSMFRTGSPSSTRPRPVISPMYSSRLVSSVVS